MWQSCNWVATLSQSTNLLCHVVNLWQSKLVLCDSVRLLCDRVTTTLWHRKKTLWQRCCKSSWQSCKSSWQSCNICDRVANSVKTAKKKNNFLQNFDHSKLLYDRVATQLQLCHRTIFYVVTDLTTLLRFCKKAVYAVTAHVFVACCHSATLSQRANSVTA